MTLQAIKYGAAANDGTGDSLREAMRKTQQNFEYLDQGKVDKVAGMGLSSNNFTNDERVKLANIQAAATKNLADAVLLERSNHTGGFNGFGTAYLMRNHDALPLTAPPSAYFGKGSFVGFAMGVEVGIPDLSYGIGRVDAHWADASGGYGVMRSFEGWGSRRFSSYALDANTWSPWLEITNRANLTGTQTLSTISDAGNAAARTVMTSQLDVTDSRLMAVGAFGLGKLSGVSGVNLDNYSYFPTGTSFQYHNGASNGPYPDFYGYVTVEKVDNLYLIQTAKATTTGVAYRRVVVNGVKGAWMLVIDTQSAVGTISTGSILETGTNANGTYTKLADGTLICTYRRMWDENVPAGYATGPSYNFAATFVGNPTISINAGFYSEIGGAGDQIYAALYGYGAGNLAYSILNTGQKPSLTYPTESIGTFAAKSYRVEATAIGRWK